MTQLALILTVAVLLTGVAPRGATAAPAHGHAGLGRMSSITTIRSSGGGGYFLLTGHKGSITAAYDAYRQPKASCPFSSALGGTGDNIEIGAALYEGRLDFSRFLLHAVGTEAFCPQFSATPIYFGYTLHESSVLSDPFGDVGPIQRVPGFSVGPGDAISSVVLSGGGKVTFGLEDRTRAERLVWSISAPGYSANGAACLMIPWGSPVKFPDFTQRCRATENGTTRGIGDFPAPDTLMRWVLVSFLNGSRAQAIPSGLTADGSRFTMTWTTSGPQQSPLFVARQSNLSGYLLVDGHHGAATVVEDSYVQPRAQCVPTEASENATGHYPDDQTALIGAGLYAGDANLTQYRLIQVGTEALCPLFFDGPPTYLAAVFVTSVSAAKPGGDYALAVLPRLSVQAGDLIEASVRATSGRLILILEDRSDHERTSITLFEPRFAPNGASCLLRPIFNLAQFARFTQRCEATVGGVTGGIGDFAGLYAVHHFDVLNATAGVQAGSSALYDDGTSFTTSWVSSQPLDYR